MIGFGLEIGLGLLSLGLELLDLRLSLRLVPGMEFRCALHKAVHDVLPGLGLGQGARLKLRLLVFGQFGRSAGFALKLGPCTRVKNCLLVTGKVCCGSLTDIGQFECRLVQEMEPHAFLLIIATA